MKMALSKCLYECLKLGFLFPQPRTYPTSMTGLKGWMPSGRRMSQCRIIQLWRGTPTSFFGSDRVVCLCRHTASKLLGRPSPLPLRLRISSFPNALLFHLFSPRSDRRLLSAEFKYTSKTLRYVDKNLAK